MATRNVDVHHTLNLMAFKENDGNRMGGLSDRVIEMVGH